MKGLRFVAGLAAATFALAGCGSSTAPPQQTSTLVPTSTSTTTTISSASPRPGEALAKGIVIHECKIGGDFSAMLTSYDQDSGEKNGSVSFTTPVPQTSLSEMSSNAFCNGVGSSHNDGRQFRTAYNEDFTKFFVRRTDESTGSNVVGYYEPESSEFKQLSIIGDEFSKTDHRYPSYHVPTGKLYFWDNSSGQWVLSSMAPTPATPPLPEPALQKPLDFHETLYTPANAELPVMLKNSHGLADMEDPAVNDAGTLAASVWSAAGVTIGPANDPIKLANDSPEAKFTQHPPFKFGPKLTPVAFIDDDSIIFTDSKRIFRADVQNGQALVTTLVDNVNEDTTIFNITLREDKGYVAFLSRQGMTTKLYVKQLNAGAPAAIRTFEGKEVRILQFRD